MPTLSQLGVGGQKLFGNSPTSPATTINSPSHGSPGTVTQNSSLERDPDDGSGVDEADDFDIDELRAATKILAKRFEEIHDQVFDLQATQQRLERELVASPDNTAVSDKLAATKAKINSKSNTLASLREDVEGNCVHLPEGSKAYLPSEDDEYT
jgi:hypothetical protein